MKRAARLFPFVALLATSAGVQSFLVLTSRIPRSSDQAVVCLMAKKIVEVREFPVFFWGSTYGGPLESYVLAILFRVFGFSTMVYRALNGLVVLLLIVLIVSLAAKSFGRRAALYAAAWLAVPPFFFLYKGLTSDGVYNPVALVGVLALLLALEVDRGLDESRSVRHLAFLAGSVAGIGLWVSPVALVVPAAAAVWVGAIWHGRRLGKLLAAIPGFVLGSAAWWIWNLNHRWGSLRTGELRGVTVRVFLENLWLLATKSSRILMGTASVNSESGTEPFPGAALLGSAALVFVLVSATFFWRRGERQAGLFLLGLVLLVISAASSIRFVPVEPRFLITFYACFAPLFGLVMSRLSQGPRGRLFGGVLLMALLTVNATSLLGAERHLPESNWDGEVTGSFEGLPAVLARLGVDRAYANYWTAYRLAFETGERVLATPLPAEDALRYEPYLRAVNASARPAVILLPPRDACFDGYLRETGLPFGRVESGNFRVFHDLPEATIRLIRQSGGLPMSREGYRVGWSELAAPGTIRRGTSARVSAAIRNDGPCLWPPSVHVGWRWKPLDAGRAAIESPNRIIPGRFFKPGESQRLEGDLEAPEISGRYELQLDLVQEGLTWFSARGGPVARAQVEVLPEP